MEPGRQPAALQSCQGALPPGDSRHRTGQAGGAAGGRAGVPTRGPELQGSPGLTEGSMVIRDLTLRSAASFGSFHLIRLLYDEYMFYLVEHRVAEATGETPIAVMGEFNDLASLSLTLLDKDDIGDERGAEADARSLGEPLVKRERSDSNHPLQGI